MPRILDRIGELWNMGNSESENQNDSEQGSSRFETLCGLTLAILAAVLAITDLGGGKYGDDEIIGHNLKTDAYAWYQSKSIKQSLVEGQRDLVNVLLESGTVAADRGPAMARLVGELDEEIQRYKKEKREILIGSTGVGEENWVLEQDGRKGQIVGAKQREEQTKMLGGAGDTFDLAVFFLQICLVVGAISLLLKGDRMKHSFYGGMVLLGLIGTGLSVLAYSQAGAFG
jgi:hypothetical protein